MNEYQQGMLAAAAIADRLAGGCDPISGGGQRLAMSFVAERIRKAARTARPAQGSLFGADSRAPALTPAAPATPIAAE